jgi:hypothetical protein
LCVSCGSKFCRWYFLPENARFGYVAHEETVESLDSGKFDDGSVLGCDFVGEVEKVGNQVSKVKVGDIVGGLIWGGNYAAQKKYVY